MRNEVRRGRETSARRRQRWKTRIKRKRKSSKTDGFCLGETWRERRDARCSRPASRADHDQSALTSVSDCASLSIYLSIYLSILCLCVCVCSSRLAYFAVFDGHGGARASQFAADNLHHTLVSKFPKGDVENLEKLVRKCLLDTFRQTDEDFLKKASSQKPAWKDGSTATCMLAVDDVLYVANLGDSRAVLCRLEQAKDSGKRKCVTLALSKEHNPTIYEERMRIQRAGGTVRDGRVLGVLEVSRSIGDGQYKRCGVISTPDLRRCQLSRNDKFVLLACDGLFKVFSADEAVQFVLDVLENEKVEQKEGQSEEAGRFEAACQRLATEAVRRGSADNVTVILVSIAF
ncbi:integrin-linked kinase-associated serine/threonine phosphatase 2C isoform X2 [Megalobrama amblycephala]|uniref:integrin-linked kinase-associated serine/threonine phosphatase 2C isoform X2 n=1 Tax=Megalobrama amblycephala TaxID=75352 RepID=UPI002013F514|nr:integrin-linked kinase-associated serine/threonine phosphatase 2C isoform X2 [Megalobrama amblycephala]XP_048015755.1 integrin-linked kinase-associated serine/threonine phosphatase 2C isoform X2 [Megalobrama amblycephala]XP_048015756.1 integrin-linked kinase-associated serine/threonine phosphatase 2C isoform X2 [Megalobrama amblycephala]